MNVAYRGSAIRAFDRSVLLRGFWETTVHPLLLAVLHAFVFLEGSDEAVVNGAAAGEAMEYLAGYLQRLSAVELRRVKEERVLQSNRIRGLEHGSALRA